MKFNEFLLCAYSNIVIQVLWLALESEDRERALDPDIQKGQPGSPRIEKTNPSWFCIHLFEESGRRERALDPGIKQPSRGRHA